MSTSAILYRGPSMLDGKPIVVVATGIAGRNSRNEKTGGLIQTWILRDDLSPVDAVKTGEDASICGDCPHRGEIVDGRNVGRSCYVTVFQAPLSVWKAAQRGVYGEIASDLGAIGEGRKVRLGSYGDPAAVPFAVWQALLSRALGSTGYTHQWKLFPALAAYCMASCDSEADRIMANALGFRTFRVRREDEPRLEKEVICPASKEAGMKTNCALCLACGGHAAKAKADVVIVAHGASNMTRAFHARTNAPGATVPA